MTRPGRASPQLSKLDLLVSEEEEVYVTQVEGGRGEYSFGEMAHDRVVVMRHGQAVMEVGAEVSEYGSDAQRDIATPGMLTFVAAGESLVVVGLSRWQILVLMYGHVSSERDEGAELDDERVLQ